MMKIFPKALQLSVYTVMLYKEADYLQLSGIQHFAFCRRQWALIHIEGFWKDNYFTMDGILKHERAHNPFLSEKRGNLLTVGDMPVHSQTLGTSGKCDFVEFVQDESGITLFGRNNLWLPRPVEHKRGSPKITDIDRLQLCAQAICLEEMLLCPQIEIAYIFYGETRRREEVPLTNTLRMKVIEMFAEMHSYFQRRHTPRGKLGKQCKACSLADICLPALPSSNSVKSYIKKELQGDGS